MSASTRLLAIALGLLAGALAIVPGARAATAPYRAGEVVVKYAAGLNSTQRARIQRANGIHAPLVFAPYARRLTITDGQSVEATVRDLRATAGVVDAHPNYVARATGYVPNDPGRANQPTGWQQSQWNLTGPFGVRAPDAWERMIALGRPGGQGVVVAVLDSGVAYRNRGRFQRSPDLRPDGFRKGYDFVDNDAYPLDHNGHGTHVASTIAEAADNSFGLVGLAYNTKIMPVRVLDRLGEGDSVAISSGIRYAAKRGAKIINLSFEFCSLGPDCAPVTADQIPDILDALRYAKRKGSLVVGAAGNASAKVVAYPARSSSVLSVGATTEHGCLASYANTGASLDLVAPGGGGDADIEGDPNCRPNDEPGGDILQVTFSGGSVRRFGIPEGYMGTSMAAPHVSATAALIVASGVIGVNPTPDQLERHLKATATEMGAPGPDERYGAGLVNAAQAVAPIAPPAPTPAPTPPPG